jgi:3-oxoadipate enol-lactonase
MIARRLDVRDASFAVHVSGSGPVLLLVHGFPLDHSMWNAQAALAEVARLVVPDLRGFGGSTRGAGIESVAQMADDVAAILADEFAAGTTDRGAIVCGLSMGGYVAQAVAARHPAVVRGLILVDTRLEADSPEARAGRADLAERVGRLGSRIAAEAMVPKLLATSSTGTASRDRLEAELRRMILDTDPETIRMALAALAGRPDMTEAMGRIDVPTLAIVGEEDLITPPDVVRRFVEVMPRAELVVLPGCGHMPPMESPAAFNRTVASFLAANVG